MIIPVSLSLLVNDKGFYTEKTALVDVYVIKLPGRNALENHFKNPEHPPTFRYIHFGDVLEINLFEQKKLVVK